MRQTGAIAALAVVLLHAGSCPVAAAERRAGERVLVLATAERFADLMALGREALVPLLDAYPTADRATRQAILLALGAMNVKSAEARRVIAMDVDGQTTAFQQIHRYALQAVDPEVRAAELYRQAEREGLALDARLATPMTSTYAATYGDCGATAAQCRDLVAGLAAADPDRRCAAILGLRLLTGNMLGYHPFAGEAARQAGVDAWTRWLARYEQSCRE
jgi:hypothetical protein